MTETAPLIRLRSSRDVLATVPRLLGYVPSRSIVFLNLHPGQGVSTMRVDLPPEAPPPAEKRLITRLCGMLCQVPDVAGLVVAVYADGCAGAGPDGVAPPRARFVHRLIDRLGLAGFAVHDAAFVAADGWGVYDGADAGALHPLAELVAPAAGDDGVAPVAADLDQLIAPPPVTAAQRRAFDGALDTVCELRAGCAVGPRGEPEPWRLAEDALDWPPTAAALLPLAGLLVTVADPDARDEVLFTWAWGPARGRRAGRDNARIRAGLPPEREEGVLDLLGLGDAPPPDRGRVGRAIALVGMVAALAPSDAAHVPLTLLAWLHWSQGRGSAAARFVARARALDPRYGLAQLLEQALAGGMLPAWAYRHPGLG